MSDYRITLNTITSQSVQITHRGLSQKDIPAADFSTLHTTHTVHTRTRNIHTNTHTQQHNTATNTSLLLSSRACESVWHRHQSLLLAESV